MRFCALMHIQLIDLLLVNQETLIWRSEKLVKQFKIIYELMLSNQPWLKAEAQIWLQLTKADHYDPDVCLGHMRRYAFKEIRTVTNHFNSKNIFAQNFRRHFTGRVYFQENKHFATWSVLKSSDYRASLAQCRNIDNKSF